MIEEGQSKQTCKQRVYFIQKFLLESTPARDRAMRVNSSMFKCKNDNL